MKNMRNLKFKSTITAILFFIVFTITSAQEVISKPILAVLNIDGIGVDISPEQLGIMTRMEVSKLNNFQIMDQYDVRYIFEKNNFSPENCYGKICVLEAGKHLESDKMLTGSVESLEETIIITMRLIDVASGNIEKTEVKEFVSIEDKIQTMISLTVKQMFNQEIDKDIENKLTKKYAFESTVNYPNVDRLNLSGPRMGFTAFSGKLWDIYRSPKEEGGFDSYPLMFQFGYQFEIKYLNQGDFQALFEFIPIITGLDQGKFIPSISILNGLRSNRTGWEFAFGPILYVNKESSGYYDENGKWYLSYEWNNEFPDTPYPGPKENRLDSRGQFAFDSGFVLGIGKTLKSGTLNIPINAFFIPGTDGHRFGLSMGFNASKYVRK